MKIGVFTIISILVLLSTFFIMTYTDKKIFDMQRDLCDKVDVIYHANNGSDSLFEEVKDCHYQYQIYSTRYRTSMTTTFLFFWLVLISWRIDSLKKH